MIDTHAHIYLPPFDKDIDQVIDHAINVGINKILLPNIDSTTIESMLKLEEKYPSICFPMIGLHPCSVSKDYEKELQLIEKWLSRRKFLAIGEIGTDLYWDKTFWNQQKEAFNFQCELALKYDYPIVIHCRETLEETIELVKKYSEKGLRGIFHCFTGSKDQAEKIIKMGFYIGIGGVSTFKNSHLDEIIPTLDKTKILLETDSPYLTPTPLRGKRNEPAYLKYIAQKLAKCLNLTLTEIDILTSSNTNALFFPFHKNN